MSHETTSNATKAPTNSSTGQQTANQASQLSGASSTHSERSRSGAESALPSSRFPEDDSGDAADKEDSSDDEEQSDQEIKGELAASENSKSSEGDMDEFVRLEELAALCASNMIREVKDDSSN